MLGESFSARDTVATETPSSRAISFIVSVTVSFIVQALTVGKVNTFSSHVRANLILFYSAGSANVCTHYHNEFY